MTILDVKNISKQYPNKTIALNKINFKVEQGEFFALLGTNGAGKSTLINIFCGLLKQSSGDVTVFDKSITRWKRDLLLYIGVMPQEVNINFLESPWSILEANAAYHGVRKKFVVSRIRYFLDYFNLWDKRHTLCKHLSGGQKRLLMLARALIHEPKLLFLDEPTVGIDVNMRKKVWNLLRHYNAKGVTIIMSTHYLQEAEQLCQRVLLLNKGKIEYYDHMASLLGNSLYKEIEFITTSPLPENFATILKQFDYELQDSHKFVLTVACDSSVSDVVLYLNQHDIRIKDIFSKKNSLESLFLGINKHITHQEYEYDKV